MTALAVCRHCQTPIPEFEWCCDAAMEDGMLAVVSSWWLDEDEAAGALTRLEQEIGIHGSVKKP